MGGAQTEADEEQVRVEPLRTAELDLRTVEVVLERQHGSAPRCTRGALTPHARTTSEQIARECVQYAASVRYHKVTLGDLSAAAGVSERRVRHAFNDYFHVSPTAYLRAAALLEVRRTLLGSQSARDAVTRAATEFGFWHLSRFASQYRALFGESPSETVARARVGLR